MGAVKAGSKASLIAGLAFGGLYGASAYLINNGKPDTGFALGFATSMVLVRARRATVAGSSAACSC
jgi:uncharacterized membrane protein (UPF0136 family)